MAKQCRKETKTVLTASKYLGSAGVGATRPQLFRASDGKNYVVKLQNNRLGPKVLANELLAARFGEQLDLCFPPAGVIKIEEQFLRRNRALAAAGLNPGRHFACQFLSGTEYVVRRNLNKAGNKSEMAGVMLFDHMVHNLDRTLNSRNLLLRREVKGYKIYAIDNSHMFGRGKWTIELLNYLTPRIKINHHRTYGLLLKHFFQPTDFAPYLAKVQQMNDDILAEIVAGIPDEWLPHDSERQALLRFLIARRELAADIVTCLCALIPNKHRRTGVNQRE
jgi:hypothetical protein